VRGPDLSRPAADTSRRVYRGRAGRALACLLGGIAAVVLLLGATSAQAEPTPVPAPGVTQGPAAETGSPTPVTPGIYGPLIGGGTMAPPTLPDDADTQQSSDPSWYDIPGQIEKAINTWLGNVVKAALEPVLHFVGATVLSSPDVSDGRIAQVWTMMLVTANAIYALFVLAGGLIVMGHETVQTRYSAKEIAPRLVVGMIASNTSLWAICQTVSLGNSLAQALLTGNVSADGVGHILIVAIVDRIFLPGGAGTMLLVLLGAVIAAMGLVLVATYLVRAAVLIILTAGAPLAFACHALPQTEGLAKLWWRAILGFLATQVAQSLTLITCVQVFFDPQAHVILGLPVDAGTLTDLLLCLVLFFILIKIPTWVHRVVMGRSPFGMTVAGRLGRSYLYYRGFTALRSRPGNRGLKQGVGPSRHAAWHNTSRPGPPVPGAGLVVAGPRPGGGPGFGSPSVGGLGGWTPGPPTMTATQVRPSSPRTSGVSAPGVPGPERKAVPALPLGVTERRDRRHRDTVASPPPRGKQFGLFPPIDRTPGAAADPRQRISPSGTAAAPAAFVKGQQPLFPNPTPRKRNRKPPPGPVRLPLAPLFISPADHPGPLSPQQRAKPRPRPAARPGPADPTARPTAAERPPGQGA
jgi:hypothetical protein